MTPAPAQDPSAAAKNASFFADNEAYAHNVATLPTYQRIRETVDREVTGIQTLIDIGNGGVFDYDTSLVGSILAVDLVPEPEAELPANCRYLQGDALHLPEQDGAQDAGLMVMLFHHLTGATADDLTANVEAAIREAARVIKPGGRMIVVESCVPGWFYRVERVLFKPLALLAKTDRFDHPPTLQLPTGTLQTLLAAEFEDVQVRPIPVGRWLMQFGRRWPARLTPARPYLFTARKR